MGQTLSRRYGAVSFVRPAWDIRRKCVALPTNLDLQTAPQDGDGSNPIAGDRCAVQDGDLPIEALPTAYGSLVNACAKPANVSLPSNKGLS
jgi:hypothetical protein